MQIEINKLIEENGLNKDVVIQYFNQSSDVMSEHSDDEANCVISVISDIVDELS